MDYRCPQCGAEQVLPRAIRDGQITIAPRREWECGSWEDETGLHHPVNTCGVRAADRKVERLRNIIRRLLPTCRRGLGAIEAEVPGDNRHLRELLDEAAEAAGGKE